MAEITEEHPFRIRNVHCETTSDFVNNVNRSCYKPLPPDFRVPVIRMYGILDNGEKCLANIHSVLPYFLIKTRAPFTDLLKKHVGKVVVKCAQLLDYKLVHGYPLVSDVVPLELKDMYGFHQHNEHFVKVLFYDASLCRRVGLTLQKECGKSDLLQPYLTHIPPLLQFFIDYSICGMGIVRSKAVLFRSYTPKTGALYSNVKMSPVSVPTSQMDVEIDIFAQDIVLDKSLSLQSEYQCSGLEFIWKEERLRCQLTNSTLEPPERPEIGVPAFVNEREDVYLKQLKQLIKDVRGEPATQMPDREFSQIQVNGAKDAIGEYVKTQTMKKPDMLEEDLEDEVDPLEMTQIINLEPESQDNEDDVITIDDEPEVIDLTEEEEVKKDKKCLYAYPDYPPVYVFPQNRSVPSSCSYPDVPTNETWCQDEEVQIPVLNRTIVFPREPPPQMSISQKMNSDLFSDSMKLSSVQNLSVMAIEVLFMCNDHSAFATKSDKAAHKKFMPDPDKDPVIGVFFSVYTDVCNHFQTPDRTGGVIIDGLNVPKEGFQNLVVMPTEKDLFRYFGDILKNVNPDITIGYDISRLSIGYLIKRAVVLDSVFLQVMSRLVKRKSEQRTCLEDMKGRITIGVWKTVRRENAMRSYRMSAVVSAILDRRYAEFSQFWIEKNLRNNDPTVNGVIFRHFLRKADLDVQILVALDVFIKTSQMSRVYGIQMEEAMTRGSQFRVESMLLRLAKDHGFCAPSVGVEQRNSMASPETMPLNMEPRSGLYHDPVVVLDFQSLYPSVCIAYNYCFTTALGKVDEYTYLATENQKIQLGALPYYTPDTAWLKKAVKEKLIHVSPVGGIFVKKEVRRGLLSMLLEELLETRVMVKQSMKKYHDNVLNRLLDARQLALKLIANVTYGYTAANFSGRMPCAEVADAIVAKGREALEKAIEMVEKDTKKGGTKYRGSQVIYGDTDSMFVLMPGLTREEAFVVGRQIAADVTKMNPYPVKLKFEKVMMPCCLMAKKRYVGMSYENETDLEGKFDAKGIETIRRDACEFVSHCMEKILRLLFNKDVNGAMAYLRYKIDNVSKVPLKHFILSGDYRVQYADSAVVPMKKIAAELETISHVHKPVYGERLEYIVADPPKTRTNLTVYNCVFRLQKFLEHPELKVHHTYYIYRKLIPALARVFQLVPLRFNIICGSLERCRKCGVAADVFCNYCAMSQDVLLDLMAQWRREWVAHRSSQKWCQNCVGMEQMVDQNTFPCYNLDCKVWQERLKIENNELEEKFERHRVGRQIKRTHPNKAIIN